MKESISFASLSAAMSSVAETSDAQILDLLRRSGSLAVSELILETGVTATAVRQRLSRLLLQGLVERQAERGGRGRPSHRYALTEKAKRQGGSNSKIWPWCCGTRFAVSKTLKSAAG